MKWMPLLLLLGCRDQASTEQATVPTTAELERARKTVATFKQTLLGELTGALGRGIPAAIETCQTRAPEIARALSERDLRVGRATRKARNPANRAEGWQLEALARFEDLHARKEPLATAHFERVLPDGRVAYAEPLVVGGPCVTCHGKQLAPEVTAALASRYPADEATGYEVGDLRGIAWVTLAR